MSSLIDSLGDLLSRISKQISEVSEDPITILIRKSFEKYYKVKVLEKTFPSRIGFVDAGIYPLDLSIAALMYIQLGALIREPTGELSLISNIEGLKQYPPIERVILTVTKRRKMINGSMKYFFEVEIRCPEKKSLLFESPKDAEKISKEITGILETLGLTVEIKKPRLYRKLSKYIESLLELAYGLKILKEAKLDKVVIDGTLVRWLRPKKARESYKIDGIDILSILTRLNKSNVIRECLEGVYGISKTTAFPTVSRAMDLFGKFLKEGKYELYTVIDDKELNMLKMMFEEAESKDKIPREVIESIVKMFSLKVFPQNNVWVLRFPLTMDGNHVMVLDVYSEKPTIYYVKEKSKRVLRTFPENVLKVNSKVEEGILKIFNIKSPLTGRPPMGLMEVDEHVRISSEHRKSIIAYMEVAALKSAGNNLSMLKTLLQIISGSMRLRYGYGE